MKMPQTDFGDGIFPSEPDITPKPRAKPDRKEHRKQHWCIELLDRIMVTDVPHWWTAVDTGTELYKKTDEARFAWENHRRYIGIKPHHLDIYLYQYPLYSQIEMKDAASYASAEKMLSSGQQSTLTALTRCGITPGLAWSVRSFYNEVVRIGFRLHGNAENIVREIEQRYAAAQDSADIKRAAPTKSQSHKPRAARASKTQLRKVTQGRWF